jgi:hypothetical protein
MINNFDEFLKARGFGEKDEDDVERNTYKYTSCGAFFAKEDWGVAVGSIVEGVDYGTETHTLTYPFEIDAFWSALKEVEDEADEIWKATHGCDDCGIETDRGMAINPDCKTCKGEGAMI